MGHPPPIAHNLHENMLNDDDDNNDVDTAVHFPTDDFLSTADNISDIIEDVNNLHTNKIVDDSVTSRAISLKASLIYKREQSSNGLPVYEKRHDTEEKEHPAFVKMELHGKMIYIRKSTAIWLFQDAERVSPDRIFRVRATQPNTCSSSNDVRPMTYMDGEKREPIVAEHIMIGDVGVFLNDDGFQIGRILQFSRQEKNKLVPYRGNYANISDKGMRVLCTWYFLKEEKKKHIN